MTSTATGINIPPLNATAEGGPCDLRNRECFIALIVQLYKLDDPAWDDTAEEDERHVHCDHDGDGLCCVRCITDKRLWAKTYKAPEEE